MTEKPSVVFLIPFASRQVRTNWSTACKYLEQTILSIRNSANQRTEYIDRVCGSCLIIWTDVADRAGPVLTEAEGMALGPVGSSFAMRDHYSLVPGSGTTTLLLNVTRQRYAAQFSYLKYNLHTFPFDGLTYRVSSDSIAGVTGDRAHKFSLRMCLGAIRRTRFITQKFRKEFMLG